MIRLSKSVIGPLEIDAVRLVLERGFLGMGVEVQTFENEIKNYLGGTGTVTCVNTGTSALHLALQALGIGSGDEVLVPTLTYVASYQAISATGATPVSCDIDETTALLDLKSAARFITSKTKAIMPVHYASSFGNLEEIYSFAGQHKLRVIEDAAHAFGCVSNGRKIGSFGDVVCFSFDGIKNITSGEGGAIVTSDPVVTQKIQDARLLGVEKDTENRFAGKRSWEFEVHEQGWRYHMSEIMAAIGRVQLRRLETEFKPKRMQLTRLYRELLTPIPGIKVFSQSAGEVVSHIQPIRVLNGRRPSVQAALNAVGIQTGIHYKPNHLLAKYRKEGLHLPVAEKIYEEILTLPLHPDLTSDQVGQIVSTIKATI